MLSPYIADSAPQQNEVGCLSVPTDVAGSSCGVSPSPSRFPATSECHADHYRRRGSGQSRTVQSLNVVCG